MFGLSTRTKIIKSFERWQKKVKDKKENVA